MLLLCAACATPGGESAGALTPADFARIVAGKTTANEVRALLGAPARTQPLPAGQGESWMYPYRGDFDRRMFWVEVSPDGTVRGTSDTTDFNAGPYRGP
ncbi:MAG: hypothetical protein ACREVG_05295 [Burkholderiales bacterium]